MCDDGWACIGGSKQLVDGFLSDATWAGADDLSGSVIWASCPKERRPNDDSRGQPADPGDGARVTRHTAASISYGAPTTV